MGEEGVLGRLKALTESPDTDTGAVDQKVLSDIYCDQYKPFPKAGDAAERLLETIKAATKIPQDNTHVSIKNFHNYVSQRDFELNTFFDRISKENVNGMSYRDLQRFLEDDHLNGFASDKLETLFAILDRNKRGLVSKEDFRHQLVLVPFKDSVRLRDAYEFFIEDLELNPDSDVLLTGEGGHEWGYFYAGGLAGVISRTCTAPFDRLKVYLIAQSAIERPSILEVARRIYSKGGGFRAFFVGNGLNAFKVFPESAVKFGAFESAKRAFAILENVDDPADISRLSMFIAGGMGGMCGQLCVYPIDTLKFRVQCQSVKDGNKQRLVYNTVKSMWADNGLRSFYRGLWVGVFGIFPFAALDLGIFSVLRKAYVSRTADKHDIEPNEVQLGNLVVLSMGAISGSIGATVVYPINLLRTRIQTQNTPGHPFSYKGFLDCVQQTRMREGFQGFFRGLGPNLAKVAPSVSISYLVYENAKSLLALP